MLQLVLSDDCIVGSRREEKVNGGGVFQMKDVPYGRTVSPLTPAALEKNKQSQAICASASCDWPKALGSFPEIQVGCGYPKRPYLPSQCSSHCSLCTPGPLVVSHAPVVAAAHPPPYHPLPGCQPFSSHWAVRGMSFYSSRTINHSLHWRLI